MNESQLIDMARDKILADARETDEPIPYVVEIIDNNCARHFENDSALYLAGMCALEILEAEVEQKRVLQEDARKEAENEAHAVEIRRTCEQGHDPRFTQGMLDLIWAKGMNRADDVREMTFGYWAEYADLFSVVLDEAVPKVHTFSSCDPVLMAYLKENDDA